uniref:ABC transporter ATP-binding protein/permease wht-1-like isoform X1 n=1 Tax=Ciona intestinalis TaxID=7719 RepID=UPI000180C5FB|nr:ABC transporter ATP-binding protein/permease wht-1-like isoform X1 [Ciona intestinalis]|eukprot:XP_002129437.4 ABC transporter ATP-binding protein/permease wht-1-like isoform X1 [Ciona intestinalis]
MTDNISFEQETRTKIRQTNSGTEQAKISIEFNNGESACIAKQPPKVRLRWNKINVSAQEVKNCRGKVVKSETKILKDVSGYAEPGRLLAIIGSSGAGKSTLLNMLTWRNKSQLYMTGDILVNGVSMGADISSISAYVEQDDLFMGELTVKEHLMFAARLRMDASISDKNKSARVQEVIHQMCLNRCENTMIGKPGITKTISGGEMKRLSLASELLTNPSIMFFDEPTSGLDSYLARMIVDSMKTVAKSGCTVICTIHQPSSEVFEMFDDLMILAMGRVVYHGEIPGALQHYADNGFPCPRNYNPADHFIMEIAIVPGEEEQSKTRIRKLTESYEVSSVKMRVDGMFEEEKIRGGGEMMIQKSKVKQNHYNTGYLTQFHACLVRAAKLTRRNPALKIKMFENLFIGIVFGLIYLRTFRAPYLSTEVGDINGCLFLVVLNTSLGATFGILNSFPGELLVFRREHANRMYSSGPYFVAKNLAEMPVYAFYPIFMCVTVYFLAGFYPHAANFFYFYLFVVLVISTGVSFGYMISCLTANQAMALIIAPAVIMPLFLFSGLFLRSGNTPAFLSWIKYISWFYFSYEIALYNQWNAVDHFVCPSSNMTSQTHATCFNNGYDVMTSYDIDPNDISLNVGCMFILFIGFRVIAFVALYFRTRIPTR